MKYLTDIHQSAAEPKQLEVLFQSARQAGDAEEFSSDLLACYQESPDNVLLAAWYYRLQASPAEPASRPERSTIWRWAVPMALISGLALGLVFALTDDYLFHLPTFILAWAPVAAMLAIAFLALVARQKYTQALAAVGLLVPCCLIGARLYFHNRAPII